METKENRVLELQTMQSVSRVWNVDFVKLPQYDQLDFALVRNGGIAAFAEIKCRTFEISRYKTSLLHLHKMMYARQVAFETSLPTFLIVRWIDCIGYVNFKVDFETTIGGRRDRGIERDYGLMAEVPIEEFTILEVFNEPF